MSTEGFTTPVTPEGLKTWDHLTPIEAVKAAWNAEGSRREWHHVAQGVVQHAMPLLARALNRLSWEEGAPPIVIDRYGNRWVIRADGLYSSEIDDGYVIQTLAEEYGPITLPDDSVVAAASDDNRDVTVAEHHGFIGYPDGRQL